MQIEATETADGAALHLLRWSGERRPFVLVHGLASNARTWAGVGRRLAASGHPVVAYDQRGHGRSARPTDGYTLDQSVADLAAVIEAAEFTDPVLVGQSWGGNLVIAAAAAGLGSGVIALDGGAIDLSSAFRDWEEAVRTLTPPGPRPGTLGAVREHLRSAHPDWPEWGIDATLANLEAHEDGMIRNRLPLEAHLSLVRAMWDNPPLGLAPRIGVGAVFIPARRTPTARAHPEAVGAMASAIDRATVHWIDGDHDLHIHRTDQIAAIILDATDSGWFG